MKTQLVTLRMLLRVGQAIQLSFNGKKCTFIVLAAEIAGHGKLNSYALARTINARN